MNLSSKDCWTLFYKAVQLKMGDKNLKKNVGSQLKSCCICKEKILTAAKTCRKCGDDQPSRRRTSKMLVVTTSISVLKHQMEERTPKLLTAAKTCRKCGADQPSRRRTSKMLVVTTSISVLKHQMKERTNVRLISHQEDEPQKS